MHCSRDLRAVQCKYFLSIPWPLWNWGIWCSLLVGIHEHERHCCLFRHPLIIIKVGLPIPWFYSWFVVICGVPDVGHNWRESGSVFEVPLTDEPPVSLGIRNPDSKLNLRSELSHMRVTADKSLWLPIPQIEYSPPTNTGTPATATYTLGTTFVCGTMNHENYSRKQQDNFSPSRSINKDFQVFGPARDSVILRSVSPLPVFPSPRLATTLSWQS